jgi:hypothetical protein
MENSTILLWALQGLTIIIFISLAFQAPTSWFQFTTLFAVYLSSCFNVWNLRGEQCTNCQENTPHCESEVRKEENKAKLKALFEEKKLLDDEHRVREERYALDEARFLFSEVSTRYYKKDNYDLRGSLREEYEAAESVRDKLQSKESAKSLRLQRIDLDIGNLKREMGAWDAWLY